LTFICDLMGFETLLYPGCNMKAVEMNEKKSIDSGKKVVVVVLK